ncbi:MAG: 3-deoxy-8-phosphooctulonate synthase [Proteobacteria bacterium]|nr:3-deoxy-8-phosphooctulonate synthase [Pseudomonadota bacterium]
MDDARRGDGRASWDLAPGVSLGSQTLPLIAGPCAIESEQTTLAMARALAELARESDGGVVFKASFDKANRSSFDSFRGVGLEKGLHILEAVKQDSGLPILTDVHEPWQCERAAEVCDVLQVPGFLCRQTDLVVAAAETGRTVNLKKGQFMAPEDMARAAEKAQRSGNPRVVVTERGSTFGYHDLVVDMRSFSILQSLGLPVIYDVTHSVQRPGGGPQSGGARQFAEPLARAAVSAGADGVYMEVHPDPSRALSDGTTQLPPERAFGLVRQLRRLHRLLAEPD